MVASEAIKKSGFDCYKIVYDTFHFYLGPDNENDIDAHCLAGWPHPRVGCRASIPKEKWRDGERVLVTDADKMASREQIDQIVALGYEGAISFEPFSADVQKMSRDALGGAEQEHRVLELSAGFITSARHRRPWAWSPPSAMRERGRWHWLTRSSASFFMRR